MMHRNGGGIYDRVPLGEEAEESRSVVQKTALEPLELDSSDGPIIFSLDSGEYVVETSSDETNTFRRLEDPWLLTIGITIFLVVPALVSLIVLIVGLIGRIWPTTLIAVHLTFSLWAATAIIPATTRRTTFCRRIVPSVLDIVLFGFVYSLVCNVFVYEFFTDVDGTPVIEYELYRRRFIGVRRVGCSVAVLRFMVESTAIFFMWLSRRNSSGLSRGFRFARACATALARLEERCSPFWTAVNSDRITSWMRRILWFLVAASMIILLWCIHSSVVHLFSWPAPGQHGPQCDPLDTTECCLPFPSFHHMVEDNSTESGWRIALRADSLPPLKGGIRLQPAFLNELDGFSTMAPLLFYVKGLKEAHERGTSDIRLQGPTNIELSVTNRSVTLLLDVDSRTLVPHTAEIDYLDRKRPLVMVFPAAPLRHNAHYALAVVQATNVHGELLPPTPGMHSLLSGQDDARYVDRRDRYERVVIPALEAAALWFSYEDDPESLQLLFDFQTISAKSQLGPVRAVRDATMAYIDGPEFGDWKDRVRAVRIEEGDCSMKEALVARTVHAEMDVPWFLEAYGTGHRATVLNPKAVSTGKLVTMGNAKFVIHVPCSLRSAAINGADPKSLRAVMEYGHGLFFNRAESSERFLLEMANRNGYIITAMDWRGMSSFDLLMVVRVLMSTPRVFQSVRDNLIQGYANKMALQHFSRHGLLDTDWLQFKKGPNNKHPVPLYEGKQPAFVFYGISQGGILGAGYSALSGPTSLIDRAILGVPGTPFALIMTRSIDFAGYDVILLRNFFNNRHVRILLSLVQMAWDPVEGSGALAPPIEEPYPQMLLQAGLGDSVVPTIACEALARALGAFTLPENPREIYGLQMTDSTTVGLEAKDTVPAILTELLYSREYASLVIVDDLKEPHNDVHVCVRRDPHLIQQIAEYINTGRVIDPCTTDGCLRAHVTCGVPVL